MKKKCAKSVVIIPSYEPTPVLLKLIEELMQLGFEKFIIVNDGSNNSCDWIFDRISNMSGCIVLTHFVNQGKGRALKTGMNYYLQAYSNYLGVITADADGQHTAKDCAKVAECLMNNIDSIVLGTRDFNDDSVPFKSKYGNKFTTTTFRLLYGKKVNDTQTGLRGINNNEIKKYLKLDGEKFEYEINMLISAVSSKVNIIEEEIETIYENNNRATHFDSVKDSWRIYKVMLRKFLSFSFASVASAIVDLMLFAFLSAFIFADLSISYNILFSTIISRVISSLFNFLLNNNYVFKSKKKSNNVIYKYYILCVMQMACSALLVFSIYNLLPVSKIIIKFVVDLVLFFISFNIQRLWVFKED